VLQGLKPVTVSVGRNQTIIEAGARVTQEQYETFMAHRRRFMETAGADLDEGLELFGGCFWSWRWCSPR